MICGHKDVTKEDVIPKWLQRKHNLSSQKFSRPNGTPMTYGKMKVSLCATCNNKDFSRIENYVARLAKSGLDANCEHDRELHIWLTKIYYFLQLFEQSRVVYYADKVPTSLVSDSQIFDAHLLHILLKASSSEPPLTYPDEDFASVWIVECSEDWAEGDFMFGSASGQNIVALKIGSSAVFSVLGDWGQYKKGRALDALLTPINWQGFMVGFEMLRFFVDRNKISTSFATRGTEDAEDLHLLPLMIKAEDMNFDLEDFPAFFNRAN